MRAPERIKPIIKFFNKNPKVFKEFLGDDADSNTFDVIYNALPEIENQWAEWYDLRFGQLLTNLDLLPHFNSLFYEEETTWLVEKGYIKFEEINFWGVSYFKNGKRRSKTKYVALKDLTDDHIASILEHASTNGYEIRKDYRDYFQKRLSSIKES